MLIETLRWTLEELCLLVAVVQKISSGILQGVERQIEVAHKLIESEPVASAGAVSPTRVELVALKREGKPWGSVASVAGELRLLASSAADLALELLSPEEDLRWRLFHLGVLGEIVRQLRALGFDVRSVHPLGGGFSGPDFLVTAPSSEVFHLWYEAGGAWQEYGKTCPYTVASSGSGGAARPLGCDVLLIRPGHSALVVECKYGGAGYVSRNGYEQALAYAVEAKELAETVEAAVLGPEGVVELGQVVTSAGPISIAPPSAIQDILFGFLS